jgi:hypothetical protein
VDLQLPVHSVFITTNVVKFEPCSWRGVLDTTLCDQVCQWLATDRWFSPGTPVSSINKTDRHDITEILLKVVLNTIKPTNLNTFNAINYDKDILVYLNTLNCPLILESLVHSVHLWRSKTLIGRLPVLFLKYFNSFFCRTNHRDFQVWNIDHSNYKCSYK